MEMSRATFTNEDNGADVYDDVYEQPYYETAWTLRGPVW